MLLLFDIDGTLVRCGGAGRRALERAFFVELGVEGALQKVRLDGSTDRVIVEDGFQAALGRAPEDDRQIDRIFDRYLSFLEEELRLAGERYQVLPGALRLAGAALESARFVLGLATGNIERGARIKLEPGGLNPFFRFGGFGSDARVRADVVGCAIARGQADAMRTFGRRFPQAQIAVIGDTELDVLAARAHGVIAVGVLGGSLHPEALRASGPDLLVESLDDPALWRAFGL